MTSAGDKLRLFQYLQIPAKSATQSGGSRPPVPAEAGHLIQGKAAGYRSEATLVFYKSQIICFESNWFSFYA
jgi:hypothetical protein